METAGGYESYAFVADLYDALATRLEDQEFGDEPEFVTPVQTGGCPS
jgi:hypothetical protein